MAWVKWEIICLPKNKGGLGIKNLELFNIALLSKWRWRSLNGGEELWCKVLASRYEELSPWRISNLSQYRLRKSSIWWRDIYLLGAETTKDTFWFNNLFSLQVHRGDKARFWLDKWCGSTHFAQLFPALYQCCPDENVRVQHLGEWENDEWRWKWDWCSDLNNEAANNLTEMQVLLQGVGPNNRDDDKWIWTADSKRRFSVKSVYCWLSSFVSGENQLIDGETVEACSKVWRCNAPSKAVVLAWRVLLNRLPTRDALIRRGILISTNEACCVICHQHDESIKHLFCGCPKIKEVWNAIAQWMEITISNAQEPVDLMNTFGQQLKGRKLKGMKHIIWIAAIWVIWNVRNKVIFEGAIANTDIIVKHIKVLSWGWFKYRKGRDSMWNLVDWLNCPVGCMMAV